MLALNISLMICALAFTTVMLVTQKIHRENMADIKRRSEENAAQLRRFMSHLHPVRIKLWVR